MVQDAKYYSEILLALYRCKVPFVMEVKDDRPQKRLGAYYTRTHRIVIHTGWSGAYNMVETAIHEYAHHLQYTEFKNNQKKQTPHGKEFWQIYGQLIWRAKMMNLYYDENQPVLCFDTTPNEGLGQLMMSFLGKMLNFFNLAQRNVNSKSLDKVIQFVHKE